LKSTRAIGEKGPSIRKKKKVTCPILGISEERRTICTKQDEKKKKPTLLR